MKISGVFMTKLFYVEDDDAIAFAVKKYLEDRGYFVTILKTIEETKRALQSEVPSLFLIDWNLPDESGYYLCKWIRERWKQLYF